MTRTAIAALIVLTLLAAVPAVYAADTTSAPAAASARDKDHYFLRPGDTVVWLGDSITAEGRYHSYIYSFDLAALYPELVAGDKKVKFVNHGISGDTAGGGLNRLSKVLAEKPTVVVICFGMNHRGGDANYAATMLKIVKQLKEAKVEVVLLTSPPVCTVGKEGMKNMVPILEGYSKDLQKIAKDESVMYVDCFTPLLKYQEDTKKDFTWGDGIHPNAEGHYIMRTTLEQAFGLGKPLAGGKPLERVTFWDGDAVGSGKSWAAAGGKEGKASLAPQAKEVHGGKNALELKCDAAPGAKGAWNLFSWAPNNGAVDVSAFKNLSMWVKVAGDAKPSAVKVYMDCSLTKTLPLDYAKRQTPHLDLLKYEPKLLDGQWHEVVVPVADFAKTEWDAASLTEMGFEAPSADAATFSVFVDDIAFKDRVASKP